MNTLDKLNVAYTAPYAIGNILSPRKSFEPIMPEMVRTLLRFFFGFFIHSSHYFICQKTNKVFTACSRHGVTGEV